MKAGSILIIVGTIFLLKELGFIEMVEWNLIWPVALIVIGVGMLFKKRHCVTCGVIHGGMCSPK